MGIHVVTGGSRGIGRAVCEEWLKREEPVWELSRSGKSQGLIRHLSVDLESLNFLALKEAIQEKEPVVQSLVCNAGYAFTKPLADTSLEDLEKIFRINVFSHYELIRILQPYFKFGAKIILFSSLAGMERVDKFPGFSAYAMSKACMINLAETLDAELDGVSVHCVSPGSVDTEMFHGVAPAGMDAKFSPEDVSQLVFHILDTSKSKGINWPMY